MMMKRWMICLCAVILAISCLCPCLAEDAEDETYEENEVYEERELICNVDLISNHPEFDGLMTELAASSNPAALMGLEDEGLALAEMMYIDINDSMDVALRMIYKFDETAPVHSVIVMCQKDGSMVYLEIPCSVDENGNPVLEFYDDTYLKMSEAVSCAVAIWVKP